MTACIRYTEEDNNLIRRNFPSGGAQYLADILGRSKKSIQQQAYWLGVYELPKKEKYVGEIVKPRDVPVFRPLSSKHIPSACARRYDADIHEIPHFVTIKDSEIDVEREEFNELFSSIVDAKLESSEAA